MANFAIDESAAVSAGPSSATNAFEAGLTRRKWLVFFGSWQLSSGRLVDAFFISSPSAVFARLWEWTTTGYLIYHLSITMLATAIGFGIGGTIGFALGLLFGRFRFAADVFDPYITALYSIPKIALAPLFIIWFGIGIASKIAVSAAVVFFVVFLNTFSGVREVNPIYINSTQIMGASQWAVMRTVIIPSAASWVITGLKVSIPYALVGTVIGEFMSANRGIGFVIAQATGMFDTASVFAGLIVLAIVGALINSALKRLERSILRWRD